MYSRGAIRLERSGENPGSRACDRLPVRGYGRALKYNGRDMKTSHAGLNITAEDWKTNVKYLVATLDKFKVREKEKRGFKRGGSLKDDIVGR